MGDHTTGYTSATYVPELNTFPAELQLQVISHLPAQDIYSFKLTCRHYRDLIDAYLTSVTKPGIQKSLSRLRLSIERCCDFPLPEEEHCVISMRPYINAFRTFRDEIEFEDKRIASRQFAAYYVHRTKISTSYIKALVRFSDDYSTRPAGRPDPTYNPSGDPRFRLVPETLYRFNLVDHAAHFMYPQERKTMHNQLAAILGVPLTPSHSPLTFYARVQRAQDVVFAAYREAIHNKLAAVLGVPPTPSHSPLTFYARTQWAQDVVFAAYMGKPFDPLRHAAVLEQTFLGHLRGSDQVAFHEVIDGLYDNLHSLPGTASTVPQSDKTGCGSG